MFTISLSLFIIIKSDKKQYFFMNIIYLFDFMENDINDEVVNSIGMFTISLLLFIIIKSNKKQYFL